MTATTEPTATPTTAAQASIKYAVKAGDTPLAIAYRFGISMNDLLKANPGLNPTLLQIGDELNIPQSGRNPATVDTATLPAATPVPTATPTPQSYIKYAVKAGDNPLAIASRFGISMDDLLQANPGLNPTLLQIGDELNIPQSGTGPTATDTATLPAATPVPTATPTPQTSVKYAVKAGDNPLAIAGRVGISVDDLLQANPGLNPTLLQIGDELNIPQSGTGPAAPPPVGPGSRPSGAIPSRIRLQAGSIGLDAPVVAIQPRTESQQGVDVQVWTDPPNAAGYHSGSGVPGQPGNIVISGRNNGQGEVFKNLTDLKTGDEIAVSAPDGTYTYVVEQTLMLPDKYISAEKRAANEAWLAGEGTDQRLTLVSAWPYDSSTHRVIVVAKARP